VNGLIGALGRINLEFTYYQRKVCCLNNMLNSDNCFVHRIMALYLHSNEYELFCKSEGVSPYVSEYSIRRHFGEKFYDAYVLWFLLLSRVLMFAWILLLVLHRR